MNAFPRKPPAAKAQEMQRARVRPRLSQTRCRSRAAQLANQFLLAMPGMLDEQFAGSVVYLFEHNAKGAMGLVVNRPTDVSLSTLLDKIELKLEITPFADQAVYFGGPVQTERGFVLHEPSALQRCRCWGQR
jgi:putative AlgH/UPF0301 family transcriptional regulator